MENNDIHVVLCYKTYIISKKNAKILRDIKKTITFTDPKP